MELEIPLHGKRAVARAGKLLANVIPASEMDNPAVKEAFRIAWNWRNSHILPMRRLRAELSAKAKKVNRDATVAARPKRMKSIRKKLGGRSLYDIQDLAGCRAILATISEVRLLLDDYANSARHQLQDSDDYIAHPRGTGYRSHHLMYRFCGEGEEAAYKRQIVEIQIRTELQHSWATAVEAVGLVRNEELKHGHGDPDWLRFFALMSSEFAAEEGCPIVPGTPDASKTRRCEIRAINQKIDAIKSLDAFRKVIHETSRIDASKGFIFLIQFDLEHGRVTAKSVPNYKIGSAKMSTAELSEGKTGRRVIETVLVEVDRASDLRKAYPNYFLDVGIFVERLRRIVAVSDNTSAPLKANWKPDMSWIKNWRPRGN